MPDVNTEYPICYDIVECLSLYIVRMDVVFSVFPKTPKDSENEVMENRQKHSDVDNDF